LVLTDLTKGWIYTKVMNDKKISLYKLVDLLECIQDANDDATIIATIDEVIDVAYALAREENE